MRSKIWQWVRRNIEVGRVLPVWAVLVRAVLFPVDTLYWLLSRQRGYDLMTDTWNIYGVRYAGTAFLMLARTKGEFYQIARQGDVVIFKRIDSLKAV